MKIIYLLFIVCFCLVSAKYLPNEVETRRALLWHSEKSESNESGATIETDEDNDSLEKKIREELEEQHRKELEREEKNKRKEEEKRRKHEEKLLEKQRKEQEKREKEERKQQERLEKERIKQLEKERKQQEKQRKQIEKLHKEAQEDKMAASLESVEDNDSLDLEDIWKNYIYDKYALQHNSTKLEKKVAISKYFQEELGLNTNSTKTEYRQAVIKLIQSNLQSDAASQDALRKHILSHVNAIGIQQLQAELERKLEKVNNKTKILNNLNSTLVQESQQYLEDKRTFLQAISQFLSNLLPNWISGGSGTNSTVASSSNNVSGNTDATVQPNVSSNNLATQDLNSQSNLVVNEQPNVPGANSVSNVAPILQENQADINAANTATSSVVSNTNINNKPTISGTDNTFSNLPGSTLSNGDQLNTANNNQPNVDGNVAFSEIGSTNNAVSDTIANDQTAMGELGTFTNIAPGSGNNEVVRGESSVTGIENEDVLSVAAPGTSIAVVDSVQPEAGLVQAQGNFASPTSSAVPESTVNNQDTTNDQASVPNAPTNGASSISGTEIQEVPSVAASDASEVVVNPVQSGTVPNRPQDSTGSNSSTVHESTINSQGGANIVPNNQASVPSNSASSISGAEIQDVPSIAAPGTSIAVVDSVQPEAGLVQAQGNIASPTSSAVPESTVNNQDATNDQASVPNAPTNGASSISGTEIQDVPSVAASDASEVVVNPVQSGTVPNRPQDSTSSNSSTVQESTINSQGGANIVLNNQASVPSNSASSISGAEIQDVPSIAAPGTSIAVVDSVQPEAGLVQSQGNFASPTSSAVPESTVNNQDATNDQVSVPNAPTNGASSISGTEIQDVPSVAASDASEVVVNPVQSGTVPNRPQDSTGSYSSTVYESTINSQGGANIVPNNQASVPSNSASSISGSEIQDVPTIAAPGTSVAVVDSVQPEAGLIQTQGGLASPTSSAVPESTVNNQDVRNDQASAPNAPTNSASSISGTGIQDVPAAPDMPEFVVKPVQSGVVSTQPREDPNGSTSSVPPESTVNNQDGPNIVLNDQASASDVPPNSVSSISGVEIQDVPSVAAPGTSVAVVDSVQPEVGLVQLQGDSTSSTSSGVSESTVNNEDATNVVLNGEANNVINDQASAPDVPVNSPSSVSDTDIKDVTSVAVPASSVVGVDSVQPEAELVQPQGDSASSTSSAVLESTVNSQDATNIVLNAPNGPANGESSIPGTGIQEVPPVAVPGTSELVVEPVQSGAVLTQPQKDSSAVNNPDGANIVLNDQASASDVPVYSASSVTGTEIQEVSSVAAPGTSVAVVNPSEGIVDTANDPSAAEVTAVASQSESAPNAVEPTPSENMQTEPKAVIETVQPDVALEPDQSLNASSVSNEPAASNTVESAQPKITVESSQSKSTPVAVLETSQSEVAIESAQPVNLGATNDVVVETTQPEVADEPIQSENAQTVPDAVAVPTQPEVAVDNVQLGNVSAAPTEVIEPALPEVTAESVQSAKTPVALIESSQNEVAVEPTQSIIAPAAPDAVVETAQPEVANETTQSANAPIVPESMVEPTQSEVVNETVQSVNTPATPEAVNKQVVAEVSVNISQTQTASEAVNEQNETANAPAVLDAVIEPTQPEVSVGPALSVNTPATPVAAIESAQYEGGVIVSENVPVAPETVVDPSQPESVPVASEAFVESAQPEAAPAAPENENVNVLPPVEPGASVVEITTQ